MSLDGENFVHYLCILTHEPDAERMILYPQQSLTYVLTYHLEFQVSLFALPRYLPLQETRKTQPHDARQRRSTNRLIRYDISFPFLVARRGNPNTYLRVTSRLRSSSSSSSRAAHSRIASSESAEGFGFFFPEDHGEVRGRERGIISRIHMRMRVRCSILCRR